MKDFADIEKIDDNYHIVSTKKSDDRKIINWISAESVRDCTLVIPDGPDLSRKSCRRKLELSLGGHSNGKEWLCKGNGVV